MVYAIINLESFAKLLRHKAAITINPEYDDKIDEYITIPEVIKLIKENSLGKDKNNNILISEESFEECSFQVEDWIYNIGLAKLAGKDLIECMWDDEKNEMVFWVKFNKFEK